LSTWNCKSCVPLETNHRIGAGRQPGGEIVSRQFRHGEGRGCAAAYHPGIRLRHAHIDAQLGFVGHIEQRRGAGRAHQDQGAHIHRRGR